MDSSTSGCYLMLLLAVVCGAIGYAIGKGKGRPTAGFWWGFLLGPLGVIVVLILPNEAAKLAPQVITVAATRRCPFCAEDVRIEAIKCKHCGSDLTVPR